MSSVILVCVFVGHIKESVHKGVSHEHEVKVLEHFNELILTSTLLEVTVDYLTTTSELAFLLDQLLAKRSCLQTSLLQLISCLIW